MSKNSELIPHHSRIKAMSLGFSKVKWNYSSSSAIRKSSLTYRN